MMMAAELNKQVGTFLYRVVQMKITHGARRSTTGTAVHGNHDYRSGEGFDHSGSHNADNTRMPAL